MDTIWSKEIRIIVFIAIYQELFWFNFPEVLFTPDWVLISEEYNNDIVIGDYIKDLDFYFTSYISKKDSLVEILSELLIDWNKTHLIVRACLLSASLEMLLLKNPELLNQVPTPYLRIADKFDSGSNVGVVHAVLSKVLLSLSQVDHISRD